METKLSGSNFGAAALNILLLTGNPFSMALLFFLFFWNARVFFYRTMALFNLFGGAVRGFPFNLLGD